MSADKNNDYKFIEEKIKPEKKRIIKENIIRAVKVILYGILFGAAATGKWIETGKRGIHRHPVIDVTPGFAIDIICPV